MTPPRVPGKRVVWFKGRPIVMSDADYRRFVAGLDKPKKPPRARGS